jgi:hypothetical protein
MTEITVIQPITDEEKVLSKEEREVEFKELSLATKIPMIHFNNIATLEDDVISKDALALKPTIPALLIRRVLDFNCIMPIVKTLPKRSLTIDQTITDYGAKRVTTLFGRAEKSKPKISKKTKPSKPVKSIKAKPDNRDTNSKTATTIEPNVSPGVGVYSIGTQITKAGQDLFYLDDISKSRYIKYRAAGFESIDVVGLVIDPSIAIKSFYILNVPGVMGNQAKLKSGNWNEDYAYSQIWGLYNLSQFIHSNLEDFVKVVHSIKGSSYYIVTFVDEKTAIHACNIIIDFMLNQRYYTMGDYIPRILSRSLDLAMKHETSVRNYSSLFRAIVKSMTPPEESAIVEIPSDIMQSSLVKKIQPLLDEIEPLVFGKFSYKYNSSIWFDMMSHGLIQYFEKLIYTTVGIASKEQRAEYENSMKDTREKMLSRLKELAYIQTANKVVSEKIYKEMYYRWIYINKFGFDRFQDAMSKTVKYGTIKSSIVSMMVALLDHVSKREKDIIELEYNRLIKYYEALESNNSPWVVLVNQLRQEPTTEKKYQIYRSLRKFLPAGRHNAKEDDWIRSKEGYPIICPHMRDQMDMEIAGKPHGIIRDYILRYAGDVPLYQSYYCRICGEAIAQSDDMEGITLFEGDGNVVLHNIEDSLKDFIWKQANQVIRNYIEFKDLKTNKFINQFINVVVNNLYDFINLIDKKLRKSKTSNLEEVENKLKLFTNIYVYAMLIKVVNENPTKIRFINGKYEKRPIKKLFDWVLEKITLTQNPIIKTLPDINDKFLITSLMKSFKNITELLSKSKIDSPPSTDITITLRLDPIFKYIARMNIISHSKGENIKKQADHYAKVASIFKQDPQKLINTERVYENAIIPKPNNEWLKPFLNISDGVKKVKKLTREEYLQEFFLGYFWTSYDNFMEYVKEFNATPVFHVKINGSEIIVKLDDTLQKYVNKVSLMHKSEQIFRDLKKYYLMMPYSPMPYKSDLRYRDNSKPSDLSIIYGYKSNPTWDNNIIVKQDETKNVKSESKADKPKQGTKKQKVKPKSGKSGKAEGGEETTGGGDEFHQHSWDIAVFTGGANYRGFGMDKYKNSQLKAYKKKDNRSAFDYGSILIDQVCSICYYPISSVQVDIPNAEKLLSDHQDITNFYNAFANKCPTPEKGIDLHVFKNDKCVNCGITKEIIIDMDIGYYKKHHSYLKEHKKIHMTPIVQSKSIKINISDYVKKWKYSSGIVNEMSTRTYEIWQKGSKKVKKTEYFNMLANLGLVENYEYDDIINGKATPYKDKNIETDSVSLSRINALQTYISELIYDYTIMQNYKNLPSISLEMKSVISNATGTITLPDSIVDMTVNGHNYYEWLKGIKLLYGKGSYYKIAEFLLECLYTMIMKVLVAITKKNNIKLAEAFVVYFLEKIIRLERNISKMKEQKVASIEATHKTAIEDDANMQDHRQTKAYDGLVADPDNFNYDNMDYDGHNEDMNT